MAQVAVLFDDDLLYLIFLYTLPSHIVIAEKDIDVRAISPINLSLVCHPWRAVVTTRPGLWGSTHWRVTHRDRPWFPRMVARWLKNSSSSPLNVSLELLTYGGNNDLQALFQLISPEYHRLSDFNVEVNTGRINMFFGSTISFQYAPSVTSFRISYEPLASLGVVYKAHALLDLTSGAASSQLRVLDVSTGVKWLLPEPRRALQVSFPLLSELRFGTDLSQNLNDVHTILSACPNIVNLCVTVPASAAASASSVHSLKPLHFIRLHHITLASCNNAVLMHLLGWLTCPSLQSLIVSATDPFKERNPVTAAALLVFTDFFARSDSHHLGHLKITYQSGPSCVIPELIRHERARALENMLRRLDGLASLDLEGLVVDNRVVEELAVPVRESEASDGQTRTSVICPKLSVFRLRCAANEATGVQMNAIEDMVESRWRNESRSLNSLGLGFAGAGNIGEASERIRACINEGLHFFHLS